MDIGVGAIDGVGWVFDCVEGWTTGRSLTITDVFFWISCASSLYSEMKDWVKVQDIIEKKKLYNIINETTFNILKSQFTINWME